jgi:hypothetical protein
VVGDPDLGAAVLALGGERGRVAGILCGGGPAPGMNSVIEDPEKLRPIAEASGLTPEAFRDRYGYLAKG